MGGFIALAINAVAWTIVLLSPAERAREFPNRLKTLQNIGGSIAGVLSFAAIGAATAAAVFGIVTLIRRFTRKA